MIALNANLDVEEVLGLLSSGRPILRVDKLADRLEWPTNRLEDVLATLDVEGMIQSMDDPEGAFVVVLSPYGAEMMGVRLDADSRKWVPIEKPERSPVVKATAVTTSEADVMAETNGRVFSLDDLAGGREPEPSWMVNLSEKMRSRGQWIPRLVRTGSTWPGPGTEIVEVGEVRDLAVVWQACPACQRSRPEGGAGNRPDCLVCERWLSAKARRRRRRDRKPKVATCSIKFRPRGASTT